MTAYEQIAANYTLPLVPFEYQMDTVNSLAPLRRAGYYLDMGTGKTLAASYAALYQLLVGMAEFVIVLMPPVLLKGWKAWLDRIPGIDSVMYRGTPKVREKIPLAKSTFTLMSYDIFKRDYDKIVAAYSNKRVTIIADEATAIKNPATANYKCVTRFIAGDGNLMVLTGSPLSTPMDAYAYNRLTDTKAYRNKNHFENVHIEEEDFFGNPKKWRKLDLLAENMKINSKRLLKSDVLKDLPPVTYIPKRYELDPRHLGLYTRIATEEIEVLADGGKIDATSEGKLHQILQQIVLNWDHFSADETKKSAGIELLETILEDMGVGNVEPELKGAQTDKVVVVAHYRMTNAKLLKHLEKYNAVAVYGDQTSAQNDRAVERFVNDPSCRVIILQPTSGGYGIDGLQKVCQTMVFLELPATGRDFHQTVARLDRQGSIGSVTVVVAVAEGTMQPKKLRDFLAKDELVHKVVPNKESLRQAFFSS